MFREKLLSDFNFKKFFFKGGFVSFLGWFDNFIDYKNVYINKNNCILVYFLLKF